MTLANLTRKPVSSAQPLGQTQGFSLTPDLIRNVFEHAKPLGHHESPANLNLGFGFLYYALVRTLRPKHIVVIGSAFGFSVVCLATAMNDNGIGRLSFVDPSYSVLTGDYQTQATWAPTPIEVGRPIAAPTPVFIKLDPGVVDEELARLAAEA